MKKFERHEEKMPAEKPTVYLILHPVAPFGVHGVYSTEAKLEEEMKRLSKDIKNHLTKKQKAQNKRGGINGVLFIDPMERYSIYEVAVQ